MSCACACFLPLILKRDAKGQSMNPMDHVKKALKTKSKGLQAVVLFDSCLKCSRIG